MSPVSRFVFFFMLSAASVVAEPIEVDTIVCNVDERGSGRVIGIARNTTDHLIVVPTLEITFVTKEQPEKPQLQRLVLSLCLAPGESQPFHSGVFSGPAKFDHKIKDIVRENVLELKSWRIMPGSTIAPSADWNARIAGREQIAVQDIQFSFEKGVDGAITSIWLHGSLDAPAGNRFENVSLIAACFDSTGRLVEVGSVPVRRRDGKCVDVFPFPFSGGLTTSIKSAPATVQLLVAYINRCATAQ